MSFTTFEGTLEQGINDLVQRHLIEIRAESDQAMQKIFGEIAWKNRSLAQKKRWEMFRQFNGGRNGAHG